MEHLGRIFRLDDSRNNQWKKGQLCRLQLHDTGELFKDGKNAVELLGQGNVKKICHVQTSELSEPNDLSKYPTTRTQLSNTVFLIMSDDGGYIEIDKTVEYVTENKCQYKKKGAAGRQGEKIYPDRRNCVQSSDIEILDKLRKELFDPISSSLQKYRLPATEMDIQLIKSANPEFEFNATDVLNFGELLGDKFEGMVSLGTLHSSPAYKLKKSELLSWGLSKSSYSLIPAYGRDVPCLVATENNRINFDYYGMNRQNPHPSHWKYFLVIQGGKYDGNILDMVQGFLYSKIPDLDLNDVLFGKLNLTPCGNLRNDDSYPTYNGCSIMKEVREALYGAPPAEKTATMHSSCKYSHSFITNHISQETKRNPSHYFTD